MTSERMAELYLADRSLAEVARAAEVSIGTVRRRLVTAGVEIRRTGRAAAYDDLAGEMARLYVQEELPLSQVAARLGCALTTVSRQLERLGVARRPAVLPVGTRTVKLTDEDLARTAELYEAGLSVKQVGAHIYLSPTAVYSRLRRAGVALRPPGQHSGANGRRFPGHAAMDLTVRLYRDEGLSTTEVGALLDIHPHSVCHRLRAAGVPLRTRTESTRLRWARRPKARAA